jgi:ADP-ribose pyrophosphatase YjhB (NUDIX family)
MQSLGVIDHGRDSPRKTDYLYRISLKCLVRNKKGDVLVVKETGRDWWDLPGGGMDHGEDIKTTIAREMREEVSLQGDFEYNIIAVEEPAHLGKHNFWQLRLIFEVTPQVMTFKAGDDGDEVAFKNPDVFKNSTLASEQLIYKYSTLGTHR